MMSCVEAQPRGVLHLQENRQFCCVAELAVYGMLPDFLPAGHNYIVGT